MEYEKLHGGKRKGSGKKPLDGERAMSAVIHVRVSVEQKHKLDLLGGAEWVRQMLDNTPLPIPKLI